MSKRSLLIGAAILLVAAPIAYYLISPLFITRMVDEPLPAPALNLKPAEPAAAMEEATTEPDMMMSESMPPGAMAEMTILAEGEFYDIAHEGMGRAVVYQLADGSRVLRFEDFQVLNGPDLHVWLVPVDPVPNTVGIEIAGYRSLGRLKGNVGSQNYELPADLDLTQFKSVVVWCLPFRVPFNAAPLAAPG